MNLLLHIYFEGQVFMLFYLHSHQCLQFSYLVPGFVFFVFHLFDVLFSLYCQSLDICLAQLHIHISNLMSLDRLFYNFYVFHFYRLYFLFKRIIISFIILQIIPCMLLINWMNKYYNVYRICTNS